MNSVISEISLVPVKSKDGLIAFCSFVLFDSIYCSSVAVYTRKEGGYRLVYPTKQSGVHNRNIFHPINKDIGELIEQGVSKKIEEVLQQ